MFKNFINVQMSRFYKSSVSISIKYSYLLNVNAGFTTETVKNNYKILAITLNMISSQ